MTETAELPLGGRGRAVVGDASYPNGRSWLWLAGGSVFAGLAVLTGLLVGPASLGVGPVLSDAASHVPFLGVRSRL